MSKKTLNQWVYISCLISSAWSEADNRGTVSFNSTPNIPAAPGVRGMNVGSASSDIWHKRNAAVDVILMPFRIVPTFVHGMMARGAVEPVSASGALLADSDTSLKDSAAKALPAQTAQMLSR